MGNRHDKFIKYWENLGKPDLEYKSASEGEESFVGAKEPQFREDRDYRIAGDRHWVLRLDWVNSDFTLPIKHFVPSDAYGDARWVLLQNKISWTNERQYRKAESAVRSLEIPSADIEDWRKRHGISEEGQANELGVNHPMYPIFMAAIEQATGGKGQRHGGARTPFLEQPWHQIAKHTGFRGLVFQAVKKAQEACGKDDYESFEREMLGSIVYASMALIHARKYGYTKEVKVEAEK